MRGKKVLGILIIALLGSIMGVVIFSLVVKPEIKIVQSNEPTAVQFTGLPAGGFDGADFRLAAEQSVHAVVHVTSKAFLEQNQYRNMWELFFDEPSGSKKVPKTGYGSGVIISPEGHIVTNNHVIEGFEEYFVKLNDGRVLSAELIGSDPYTDLAVLEVKEKDLPYMVFGNSDELRLGDWVLAVGNPFNLYSTITAGIISAKARGINIIGSNSRDQYGRINRDLVQNAVESYIQTDAAVNPGNSGGALVNLKGELVGINSAIASMTGSYSGYSFAIPAVIAKKITDDLIEFGEVQRAVLGIIIKSVDAELVDEEKLDVNQGIFVEDLTQGGGANTAGIKQGDVIVAINSREVNSSPELKEQLSRFRPNDVISVEVDRSGVRKDFQVTLNEPGSGDATIGSALFWAMIGADLEKLDERDLERINIRYGVRVKKLHDDGQFKNIGMPEGFVITRINNNPVRDVNDVKTHLEGVRENVYIEGKMPNGRNEVFSYKK